MDTSGQQQPTLVADPAAQAFLVWCLHALGFEVQDDGHGVYTIAIESAAAQGGTSGPARQPLREPAIVGRQFTLQPHTNIADENATEIELLSCVSPIGRWIRRQIAPEQRVLHATPSDQPASIHALAQALFAPYHVEGGHVHLTGCRLEDRPFLRLSYVEESPESCHLLATCFAASDGHLLDQATQEELALSDLVPLAGKPPQLDAEVMRRWIEIANNNCAASATDSESALSAATVVWCKYAIGKLSFTIDANTAELEFSGWARSIRDGKVVPPPFTCPWTGKSSYNVAATDDGRITVAEAIVQCEESGRRVLASDLQTCEISGRKVLPEYLVTCPITQSRVLPEYVATCAMCGQRVSQTAIGRGLCAACRSLDNVSRDDPVVARIVGTYPKLARFRRWKMAETDTVYVLVAKQFWKRVLLVLDKETLEPHRVANAGPLGRHWLELPALERSEWFG